MHHQSENTVLASASLNHFLEAFELSSLLDLSEWAVEVLAQAAPLLLPSGCAPGVIAKIDSLIVREPLSPRSDRFYARLERLSPPESPLAHFRGAVGPNPELTPVLVEAEFKLSLNTET